jgi:DNA-binding transcriptional ArsR family regulator
MSRTHRKRRPEQAVMFAALGDATRLALIRMLSAGDARSIAELTHGMRMTRQAVTNHLRVLERVGIVRSTREGREHRFALDPQPIAEMNEYLVQVSRQWDMALARLKSFVED